MVMNSLRAFGAWLKVQMQPLEVGLSKEQKAMLDKLVCDVYRMLFQCVEYNIIKRCGFEAEYNPALHMIREMRTDIDRLSLDEWRARWGTPPPQEQ